MERPKVKLCQIPTIIVENESDDIKKGKIKVKSIVPTNFPIKVLDNGKRVIIRDENDVHEVNAREFQRPTSSVVSNNELKILFDKNSIDSKYMHCEKTNQKSDLCNVQNCIDGIQKMCIEQPDKISNNEKIHGDNDEDNANMHKNIRKCNTSNKLSKHNFKTIDENKNLNRTKTIPKENKENCSENGTVKKGQGTSMFHETRIVADKQKSNKFKKSIQVMPCAKFRITNSSVKSKLSNKKSQSDQVKKSTVFHVNGNHCNVSVQAGSSKNKKTDDTYTDTIYDTNRKISSSDLLSRPEYNSMVNIMRNMKEIENEKLVTDYKDLTPTLRHLVSEKVTTALDFPLYETVYKDLIDLTIDDDKLPTRIMRSKDPEPRDKDIVPKLSDFYNPKYKEQYFTIANPKPLDPVNLNTLSAFTISNKLCQWKICRDNF